MEVLTHLLSPTAPKSGWLVLSTHHKPPALPKQGFGCRQVGRGDPCGAALPSLPLSSLPLWRRQLTAA